MTSEQDSALVEPIDIERDIRIAVWNTCRWQGRPQEVAQSFIRHLFDDEPAMKRAMGNLTHLTTEAHDAGVAEAHAWRDIASAPRDENIIAAVQVQHNKTGDRWWEIHTICIDSETGEMRPDNDAGWGHDDYTHWQPLPSPPASGDGG